MRSWYWVKKVNPQEEMEPTLLYLAQQLQLEVDLDICSVHCLQSTSSAYYISSLYQKEIQIQGVWIHSPQGVPLHRLIFFNSFQTVVLKASNESCILTPCPQVSYLDVQSQAIKMKNTLFCFSQKSPRKIFPLSDPDNLEVIL